MEDDAALKRDGRTTPTLSPLLILIALIFFVQNSLVVALIFLSLAIAVHVTDGFDVFVPKIHEIEKPMPGRDFGSEYAGL